MRYSILVIIGLFLIGIVACTPKLPTSNPETSSNFTDITPRLIDTPMPNFTATVLINKGLTATHQTNISAQATATAKAKKTILAQTPSRTPRSTVTATTTIDFSKLNHIWKRYENISYGISFEYPALYDEKPLKDIGCQVQVSVFNNETYFDIGERIQLSIVDGHNKSLQKYVDELLTSSDHPDVTILPQEQSIVGDVTAVKLPYRFGGSNRYGESTVVWYKEKFYIFDYSAGSDCIIVENNRFYGELDYTVYLHILETFNFTQ